MSCGHLSQHALTCVAVGDVFVEQVELLVSPQVGVLTRHILDDGRGFARSKVFKHGHEEATGRTSSIGQHNLCVCSSPLAKLSALHEA